MDTSTGTPSNQDILDEMKDVTDAGRILENLIIDAAMRENGRAFNKLRTAHYYLYRRFEELKDKLLPPTIFLA